MLRWRLAVSAVLIPLFVGLFWLDARLGDSAPILLALVVCLAVRGASEMVDLLWTRSFTPNRTIVSACCVSVAAAAWWGRFGWMPIEIPWDHNTLAQVMLAYSLTILVLFLLATYRYREPGASMETLSAELMIVSYIGVLLGVASQLRWVAGAQAGYLVIGSLLIGVLLNGLVILNVSSYIQQIIIGVIIVLAVAFDTFAKSRRRSA